MQERRTEPDEVVLDPEDVMRTVATNLYRARVNALPKMSQEVLADKAGVSVNTIAKIEALRDPQVPITEGFQFGTVLALGAALRLSAEKLFMRVSRAGEVPHLHAVASRAGPPLPIGTPTQSPLVRGVSSSKVPNSKCGRANA